MADLLGLWDSVPAATHENPWAIRNPRDEARDLYRMVRSGSSGVEDIRELIAVPDPIKEALLAYAERFPRDGQHIHCVLLFREKVAEEFESLIKAGPGLAELPLSVEEETDSGSFVN